MANGKVSQKDILNLINKKAGRQIAFTAEEENPENDKPPDDPTDDVSDNLLRWIEKKDK